MKFVIPVESMAQKKGGVILYDPDKNKILKQYVHDKKWKYRVGWRGGTVYGDTLIATDWTDLHFFDLKKWKYIRTFKKSTFNDLHYVRVFRDKLYVVNTGIDAVEVFNDPLDPKFEELIFVFNRNKELFGKRKIDLNEKYNERFKVKPHFCHPNCIEFDKKRIFVTCFEKKGKLNTGEVIELNSGKRLYNKNYSCHDGNYHGNDFFLSQTRAAKILVFKDLKNNSIPTKPNEIIPLKKKGWWRGMVVTDDFIYVFTSFYSPKKITTRMARVHRKNPRKINFIRLPSEDGMYWDTVYQPTLLEE